jgi:hypothetical protein
MILYKMIVVKMHVDGINNGHVLVHGVGNDGKEASILLRQPIQGLETCEDWHSFFNKIVSMDSPGN